MAKKSVSFCRVTRNSKKVENLKNFKEGEHEYRHEEELMDSVTSIEKTYPYKFSLEYAIPTTGAKLDWSDVVDETWTIALNGGNRKITFSGVDCVKRGETTYDGQNIATIPLEFVADRRDVE